MTVKVGDKIRTLVGSCGISEQAIYEVLMVDGDGDAWFLDDFGKRRALFEGDFETVSTLPDIESPSGSAASILEMAASEMQDRATTYDNPQGERSMGKAVSAFNAIYGHSITEEQGWQFMAILKMVRASQGDFKLDNYVDQAAYSALAGECAALFDVDTPD